MHILIYIHISYARYIAIVAKLVMNALKGGSMICSQLMYMLLQLRNVPFMRPE